VPDFKEAAPEKTVYYHHKIMEGLPVQCDVRAHPHALPCPAMPCPDLCAQMTPSRWPCPSVQVCACSVVGPLARCINCPSHVRCIRCTDKEGDGRDGHSADHVFKVVMGD
jgi:hypothetical protein